jgi:hypothetical protein
MTEDRPPPAPSEPACGPPFDLEEFKAQVRAAVARRRPREVPGPPPFDWDLLAAGLERVQRRADIGAGVPELPRFRGPFRLLGRLLAACVLFFSRFLTNRQRDCNHAMLGTLRTLSRGLRRLEESQRAELQRLREEMERRLEQRKAA